MIVGIDLGTTNSAVAIWRDGRSQLIPNALGEFLTPSAVSVVDGETILLGAAAKDRQPTHPRETVTIFKRNIGTRKTIRLGQTDFSAEDLSALILKSLKDDAEAFLGEPVTGAVITVPAYFNDKQRKATRRAGELAGLKVERLINEPTAAALAFGVHEKAEKEAFLVFDLGGGTFDVSIVEMFDGVVEVRASAGNNRLGGEDFNDCLIDLARGRIDPEGRLSKVDPIALRELLRVAAERARRDLSEADRASFSLTHGDDVFSAQIETSEFEAHAETLMAQLRDPVLRSLRDSGVTAESLSEVVLVGGATRMPIVRRAITRMFGRFPNASVHPDHAVALGAAVQAGLLARDEALDEIRLTDVCPFTLGVDQAERDMRGNLRFGLFSPIIERNSAIPISRVNYYCTIGDGQTAIQFGIYQGEARDVSGNVKLGELKVPVPPRPAGEVVVECRFSYDTSGLLEVDVLVPGTGTTRNLVIVDDADAMTSDDIARRRAALAELKFHPREDAMNAALLARATRCYEAFIGEKRERVGRWITAFESVLDAQDDRRIRDAQTELAGLLDALEGERFL